MRQRKSNLGQDTIDVTPPHPPAVSGFYVNSRPGFVSIHHSKALEITEREDIPHRRALRVGLGKQKVGVVGVKTLRARWKMRPRGKTDPVTENTFKISTGSDLPPGDYTLSIEVLDAAGNLLRETSKSFQVGPK